jgi:predicted nucleic acid-binding protein
MEKVIADTSFIVALGNRNDPSHNIVKKIYLRYQSILLPQTVLAEVAYLLGRENGIQNVVFFLQKLPDSRYSLVALEDEDLTRTAEILEKYKDSRIDFVDATVMAMAERFKIKIVLTLDNRDFSLFSPRHCDAFLLLP